MHRLLKTIALFLFLLLFYPQSVLWAQWEVSTLVSGGSGMEDGLVLDKAGNIYVSQYDGTSVRKVTPDGQVSVYASGFNAPNGLAMDDAGNLYVTNAQGGRVSKVLPDGTVIQRFIDGLNNPVGLALNAAQDTLYISHYQGSKISRVALADSANVTTWVSGGLLNGPVGLTFDDDNNLYAGNFNNGHIIKIAPNGTMERLTNIPASMGFVTYSKGVFYATSFSANKVYRISADGTKEVLAGTGAGSEQDGPALSAAFNGPNGIVATPSGDTLYVSDYNAESLRMIVATTSTGAIDESEIPQPNVLLDQNFPNPFRETTTITYHLDTPRPVDISIYNVLGQKIRTLASQIAASGLNSIAWDGLDDAGQVSPAGIYVYTLNTGPIADSKTMLLMR